MKNTIIKLPEMKLVGITARTNNLNEMNILTAKISPTIMKFFQQGMQSKILHRKKPGVVICAYNEYESDYTGDYTYFIGEEVESFDEQMTDFHNLTVPVQTYTKFTTDAGVMPLIAIDAWQKIWQNLELNDKRNYTVDFELYDERAKNPASTILDIFIGIKE